LHQYQPLGAALLLLLSAASLPAQLAPVGTPKGSLRFDIQGVFQSADRRLFGGQTEDYLTDFGSPAFGSDRIGLLRPADSLVGRVLGQSGYRLNLGVERARGQLTIGSGIIGAALGVTNKLTLFGHIPYIATRVQATLRNDSTTGDGGLNPAHPALGNPIDQALADAFFSSFDQALTTLQSRIQGGIYTGPGRTRAEEILSRGQIVRDALYGLTRDPDQASPFVPLAASATGQEIVDTVRGLQVILDSLGVSWTSATTDPVLAGGHLTDQQFNDALINTGGPFEVFPPIESRISRMGDMDVGAIYTLVDRFDRPGRTGGFRFAVAGLLRLPTGQRDNPNSLLDVGTGNGRYEVGAYGTADLGAGRVGTRLSGGYLLRLPALRVRRVGDVSAPYAGINMLTNVRENAGDILSGGARPFFRLVRNVAIHGMVDYTRIGADVVAYNSPADAIPGIAASALANGSRSSLAVGGGVTYVGRAAHECERGRRCGWPIDAAWNYSTVVSGTGGRVVKFRTTTLEIRWYQRLWR
jgi:hypothetical protein